jgi:hypothetical protein
MQARARRVDAERVRSESLSRVSSGADRLLAVLEGPSTWIRVRACCRDRRTAMDPFRSRWRFLPTRTRWSSARWLPLTERYDGSRLRNLVDIPGIGRHEQPVVQERERVIGRVVEGHVEAARQFDGFREPGMRGRGLLEPKLHQCRQPVRSVRRETPCDRIADFVEPQRRQERGAPGLPTRAGARPAYLYACGQPHDRVPH